MENEPTNCPHCKTSLLGDAIPDKDLHHYNGTHWKREIGVEMRGFYDGIAYWRCPDCDGKWGPWYKMYLNWMETNND